MFYFPCAALSLVLVSNFVAKNRGMQKPLPQLPGGGGGAGVGDFVSFCWFLSFSLFLIKLSGFNIKLLIRE